MRKLSRDHQLGNLIASLAFGLALLPVGKAFAGEVAAHVLRRGKWEKWKALTVGQVRGFRPAANVRLSKYGGWLDRKVAATGFFRTKKVGGRWWLVDPEGCLFISIGLCSVNQSCFSGEKMERRFGSEEKWAVETGKLLKSSGFNSLGCWSDWGPFRPTPQRMPYFPRWNVMSSYKNRRPRKTGEGGYPHSTMPVFDPEFEKFADGHCKRLAEHKDDPWLVGHFSDNELPFRPNLLELFHKLPATDPGHKAAAKWWEERRRRTGDRNRKMTGKDHDDFLTFVAERYYTICNNAIKKHDPNHLYVGSRVHGRCIRDATFRGAGACDVVSVNYYHRWSAEQERMDRWVKASGKPFLVSEWYAQSIESADTEASGAGFRVKSDAGRGLFYQNLTLGLLENPGCVGWHWFKYGGDGKGFHKGFVSRDYVPHVSMIRVMAELNRQVYPLAGYFQRKLMTGR